MGIKRNGIGMAKSIPVGLVIAAVVSMMITVASSAVIAYCLNSEKMTWIQAGYWIMGMLFISSLLGGKSAYLSTKRKRFVISAMSGLLYWGILLCITALFFGGDFSALWETGAVIGAGSATAALISVPSGRKNGRKVGVGYR